MHRFLLAKNVTVLPENTITATLRNGKQQAECQPEGSPLASTYRFGKLRGRG
jgi:hypothetical protein